MRTMIRLVVLGTFLGGVPPACFANVGSAAPQMLTLRTEDGATIAAELRAASTGRPAPGVILVHMLTRTHEDWQVLAARLSDAGLAVLAIDLRGHGASGRETAPADLEDMNSSVRDVRAARVFLSGRPDICSGRIGIAGAQIGANLAIVEASSDLLVRSLALLSPGLEYRKVWTDAAMKKYNERPALIVASTEDAYASRSARELSAAGTGTRELRLLNGAGHGTVMLARHPDLISVLVDWFRRTLL
jgi:pimeloyl-ACP methyl ester carboxylesterase